MFPSEPPTAAAYRRDRRKRAALVAVVATPVVVAVVAAAVFVAGLFSGLYRLSHGIPGERLLEAGQRPAAYPAELVNAYRTSASAEAGCPLLQGRARGVPTFRDMGGAFVISYPDGLDLDFSTEDGTAFVSTPLPGRPWHGQLQDVDGLTTLVDGPCRVAVFTFLDRHADSDELAMALSLAPVAGPAGALRPPVRVPTLAELLRPAFGSDAQPADCGEADIDVAGARATPGCHAVLWADVEDSLGSTVSVTISQYRTPKDAAYQFSVHRRYMRQYAGTTIDETLPAVSPSSFILTNDGQQCEAFFVIGSTEVEVNASGMTVDRVAEQVQRDVRTRAALALAQVKKWRASAKDPSLIGP